MDPNSKQTEIPGADKTLAQLLPDVFSLMVRIFRLMLVLIYIYTHTHV